MISIWYFAEVGILTVCLVLLRGGPPLSWFVTPADRPESSPTPCHMKSVKVFFFFLFLFFLVKIWPLNERQNSKRKFS